MCSKASSAVFSHSAARCSAVFVVVLRTVSVLACRALMAAYILSVAKTASASSLSKSCFEPSRLATARLACCISVRALTSAAMHLCGSRFFCLERLLERLHSCREHDALLLGFTQLCCNVLAS